MKEKEIYIINSSIYKKNEKIIKLLAVKLTCRSHEKGIKRTGYINAPHYVLLCSFTRVYISLTYDMLLTFDFYFNLILH